MPSLVQFVFVVFVVIKSFVLSSIVNGKLLKNLSGSGRFCTTLGCLEATRRMYEFVDFNVPPCENFYKFACGNWIKKQNISRQSQSITVFDQLKDQVGTDLKAIIENIDLQDAPYHHHRWLKKLYEQCLYQKTDQDYEQEIVKEINQVGGWPLILGSFWDESDFDLLESFEKLRELGYSNSYLANIDVNLDLTNNTRYIINVDEFSPSIPFMMLDGAPSKAYLNLITEAAKFLTGKDEGLFEAEVREIYEFEKQIFKMTVSEEKRSNLFALVNIRLLEDLSEFSQRIPWAKIIQNVIGTKLSPKMEINIIASSFLRKVSRFLTQTSKRQIANYLSWRMVFENMPFVQGPLREIYENFLMIGTGRKRILFKVCMDQVKEYFEAPLSALYIENYFDPKIVDKVGEIIDFLRVEMIKGFEKALWMDARSRDHAIQKILKMKVIAGYPPELLKSEKVAFLYQGEIAAQMENSEQYFYFQNIKRLSKHFTDYSAQKLFQQESRSSWWEQFVSVANINAYYHANLNTMFFPAAILRSVFFQKDQPGYLNFGGIGSIIAHEMSHAFDEKGRLFDSDGNLKSWLTPKTEKRFYDRLNCLVSQYNNYVIPEIGMTVNGHRTMSENLADNEGAKIAVASYRNFARKQGDEPPLFGLSLSSDQLFWVALAHIWCSKLDSDMLRAIVMSDVHAPSEFRVIGPLSNIREFSKIFNCPVGSTMSPYKKCDFWVLRSWNRTLFSSGFYEH